MAQVLVNDSSLQAIANAIRSKNGFTTKYTPSAMAAAINSLSSGLKSASGTATISSESNTFSVNGLKFKAQVVIVARRLTSGYCDFWGFSGGTYSYGNRGSVTRYSVSLSATTSSFTLTAKVAGGSSSNALFASGVTWEWYAFGL